MTQPPANKLRHWLLLRLLLVFASLVVGFGLIVGINETQRQHTAEEENMAALSVTLAGELSRMVTWDDRVALQRVLAEVVRIHGPVVNAFILLGDRTLAHTFTSGVPAGLLRRAPHAAGHSGTWTFQGSDGVIYHDTSTPIPGVGARLHLLLSEQSIKDGLPPLVGRLALLVTLGLLLGALLSWLFAHWATREMARLTADLSASRTFMQSVIDSMPFPLVVIGRDYEILHTNKAMHDHAGGQIPPGTSARCHDLFHDLDQPCEACPHRIVLATSAPVSLEQTRSGHGKSACILEVSAAPLFDEHGEVLSVIKTIRDITERKQLELNQLKRVKLEGVLEMAGAACHEVGQPLQSLMYLAGGIKRRTSPDDPCFQDIDDILGEVTRLGSMVHKIMRITRYESMEYLEGVTIVDIHKSSSPE